MADRKNQHYVPKIHFRAFSRHREGKAINLYLIDRDEAVFGAPIRGQCARDYIYGKDGVLESVLGRMEARYGGLMSCLSDESYRLSDDDCWLLKHFMLLQSQRTAEQIERFFAGMSEAARFLRLATEAHGDVWNADDDPRRDDVMKTLISGCEDQMRAGIMDDLKLVILRNRTKFDFVTSDDPTVTTNRWLIQRKNIRNFGLNAAGLLMFLPIGPRMLALLYDPAVYTVPSTTARSVDLTKEADVLAFNEHQYMRAVAVIYFSRKEDARRIAEEFKHTRPYRPAVWNRFTVGFEDGGSETHTRYSIGLPEEVAKKDAVIFHFAREFPSPRRWPSMIRIRDNAHGFTKGRLIVRSAHMATKDTEGAAGYRRVD